MALGNKSHLFLLFLALISLKGSRSNPPLVSDWALDEKDELIDGERSITRARLPTFFTPSSYNLEIQINLDDADPSINRFTARGKITIRVTCHQARDAIVLHSLGLTINQIEVRNSTGGIIQNSHFFNEPDEFLIISLTSMAVVDEEYDIYIDYYAQVSERQDGLYRSWYRDFDGSRKWMAITDFEPTDSRRAWPCFDEPQMKATWKISIIRKEKYISLSNTELVTVDPDLPGLPGWRRDNYAATVKTSTYLVAVSVNEFLEAAAAPGLYNKPISVWGPAPLIEAGYGDYSPDASAMLIQVLETYFNMTYHLSKLDKIAINLFSSGAMENWGLNTYREIGLLWKEGENTWDRRIGLTNTLSHELVHQWAGNAITMLWWNDIYLNEGFATYFSVLAVNAIYPHYKLVDNFIFNTVQNSMQADVLPTSHPLSSVKENIQIPTQIKALFSTVTYHKGASILRMFNYLMGESAFMTGIRNYYKANELDNAQQDDLFVELNDAAINGGITFGGHDLTDILKSWTVKSGFPVLYVTRDFNTGNFTVRQEKYRDPASSDTWIVPIFKIFKGQSFASIDWLDSTSNTITFSGDADMTKWMLINLGQAGFYRVNYDTMSFHLLSMAIQANAQEFSAQMRSGLLDDSLDLGFNGYRDLIPVLEMTKYLKQEKELQPWATFFNRMSYPHRMISRTSSFYKYRKYLLSIIPQALENINYEHQPSDVERPADTILLRTRLFDWACNVGDPKCIQTAKDIFARWMADPSDTSHVYPDQQASIYCHAIANGGDDEWNFIYNQYLTFDRIFVPEAMLTNLIMALGCPKDAFRLNKLLDLALDHRSDIRSEHRLQAIQAVASNTAGTDLTIQFLRNNFDTIISRYGTSMIAGIVTTLSGRLNRFTEGDDLRAFLQTQASKLDDVWPSIVTSINAINANIAWMDAYFYPSIQPFLNGF